MANRWIAQTGAGAADGTSFANRAHESSFVTMEAAVGSGEFLYISAETITLSGVWTITGVNKQLVGVNATTGADDGSIAILDAGNTHAHCVDATNDNYTRLKNLELIRAFSDGLRCRKAFIYNVKMRNNGGKGAHSSEMGTFENCHANNNSSHGLHTEYGQIIYSQAIGNGATGLFGNYGIATECITHANVNGVFGGLQISRSVIDGNTNGVNNTMGGGWQISVCKCSITNNTTAITTDSSDYINEEDNYFYNNTTKFGGTTANIISFGASQDGIVDPYVSQSTDNFAPSAGAPMKNRPIRVGMLADTNNISYLNSGLNPIIPSSSTPTFAGITGVEALTTGKFKISWSAGSGTITGYSIYIRNASSVFSQKFIQVDPTLTSAIISTLGDGTTFFVGGTTYYFGVRASNAGSEDSNTVEISEVCTGSETVQRVNNFNPVVTF
jgi:hypothetical protein